MSYIVVCPIYWNSILYHPNDGKHTRCNIAGIRVWSLRYIYSHITDECIRIEILIGLNMFDTLYRSPQRTLVNRSCNWSFFWNEIILSHVVTAERKHMEQEGVKSLCLRWQQTIFLWLVSFSNEFWFQSDPVDLQHMKKKPADRFVLIGCQSIDIIPNGMLRFIWYCVFFRFDWCFD